jgi:CheY-like chemotaxis protein
MAGERILIVEDQVALEARPLERLLKKNGYVVVGIARSADEAVTCALSLAPAIVLMDIWLPPRAGEKSQYGGIAAAAEIRRQTNASILFVTCDSMDDPDLALRVRAAAPGARFVTKPYSKEQLLSNLRLELAERSAARVVFICYSHRDVYLEKEMLEFLQGLQDLGITAWDDKQIPPGEEWAARISRALDRADAAILLVSVHFMNSDYIRRDELRRCLAEHQARNLMIIPVYVGHVIEEALELTGLLKFQGFGAPGDPVSSWKRAKRQSNAWVPLCKRLTNMR